MAGRRVCEASGVRRQALGGREWEAGYRDGGYTSPMGERAAITIPVTGMTCAACQARVQRALARTPGVDDAAVNLMMNSAAVTYDPSRASPAGLVDAIRATGYGAELPTATPSARRAQLEQDETRRDEFRNLRAKAGFALAVGVAEMAGSITLSRPVEHFAENLTASTRALCSPTPGCTRQWNRCASRS